MSTAERKAREKEALKSLILKGAKKLFLERGIEQTTIRNIADEIDYSVGTVYVYFKDKNAILHDLHSIGFQELGGYFKELFAIKDPMERIQKMGFMYIKFALENPEMYDLMFNLKAPMEFLEKSENENWNEGANTFNYVKKTIKECIDKGHFKEHNVEPLSFMIWSLVHGMCCLEIRQRTKGVKFSNPDTILFDGYNEYLKIIKKL
ncbi:transcriptional regulator, TetR family [Flavobacterium sp. CF108]|jgi:AcrR family transcriptional regulator|uniref:TetR/AcrR family transcriptional regulator n=1 Tax=unclassified Flavobacterium TaxID=196869 RepID=UPI0008C2C2BD|nr:MULTISPECIES: TetR/AcrR family transcriptional regulator [unclassified Flavobacterium]SEO20896.1 transcriptional regulator, TetR family [Flavobacterium sp. fv08]SHG52172.1 transcriptional regulator, TetR family [Flavobacterium sp. CF108]